jgi:hypothetical protein
MQTPGKVNNMQLYATCESITVDEWERLMNNTTKANGQKIRQLIKKHIPELYEGLGLKFNNPYEHESRKKPGLLVYVHSAIEYFIQYD